MPWFEKEMDYARISLEQVSRTAIEHASEKLDGVVKQSLSQAGQELREVVVGASQEIDAKLDKIWAELHNQRQFTKDDVIDLVDYAADKLGQTLDERVRVIKLEITALVQEKVEYLKSEVDAFFIQRQQDLARERRRLIANIVIAATASIVVAGVSLLYHRYDAGSMDLFGLFRILFASLAGGYVVYLLVKMVRRYTRMSEHRKDLVYLGMRYWGVLRPESLFAHVVLLLSLAVLFGALFFPELLAQMIGNETLIRWVRGLHGQN